MNTEQCVKMMAAMKSGCQSEAAFWAAVAELQQSRSEKASAASSDVESSAAAGGVKKRGPKPLAERTPEQQAAHAAKMAARAAEKASGGSVSASATSSDAEGPPAKKRGPKPLAERTPEQQAAHAAKMAARAAEKASVGGGGAAAAAEPKPKQQSETQKAWLTLVGDTVKEMGAHGWKAWTDVKSGTLWPASELNAEGQYVYSAGPHAGKTASHQRGGMARASYIKSQVVGLQGEWAEMEKEE